MESLEEQLTDMEALAYRSFAQQFPVLMVLLDPGLQITWASPGARSVLGVEPSELVGRSVVELIHPDDLGATADLATAAVQHADETLNSPAASALTEFPVRIRNGAGTWQRFNASGKLLDAQGTLLGVIRNAGQMDALDSVISGLGAGGDLSSVLEAVIKLAKAQFKVDRACIIHDAGGEVQAVCGAGSCDTARSLRLLRDGRRRLCADVIIDGDTWITPILSETGETLFGLFEMPARRPEGPAPLDRHLLDRVASLASIAFARHRDDMLLTEAASTDYLTGVANRRHFEARLAELAVTPGALPLALLYIDVDDFKVVNDTHGHKVGDEVLAGVARRLANVVRPGDFVGRLGGDEFAIAAPGMDRRSAQRLVDRVTTALEEPVATRGVQVPVGVSIGIADAQDEDALETILERGDDDMFHRKRARP